MKTFLFSLMFSIVLTTVYGQKNKSYSSEIDKNKKYSLSLDLVFYKDEGYVLLLNEISSDEIGDGFLDQISKTELSVGTVFEKKDTLILKDCLYGFELCYLKRDSMLVPIKTYCSLMDRVLNLCSDCFEDDISVSDWCVSKEANEHKEEMRELRASVKDSKSKPVIDTGVYYHAQQLPDGSFFCSDANIPVLTLHADGTYEIKSEEWDSLSWSKGFWKQKNRLLILQDECTNYEEFLIIKDDKKLYGIFSLYNFFSGGYFIDAKTVKKMNNWK